MLFFFQLPSQEVTTGVDPQPSQLEEESTGMDSFHVAATSAHNLFVDQVNMPGARVLQSVENKKRIVNPYKLKPTHVDNRHSFVPERDIPPLNYPYRRAVVFFNNPKAARQFKPSVVIVAPRDESLGHLGGAEIDFGNSNSGSEETGKTETKKFAKKTKDV